MSDIQQNKLGDLCTVSSSKRIYAHEYVENGVPFYRSKEIIQKHNGDEINTELFITEERYAEIKEKFGAPSSGDMLMTSVGTLGVPYIVQPAEKFYFKDGNLTWYKNFSDKLDSKYLFYLMDSEKGKELIKAVTIGSSQAALTIDGMKELLIPCPAISIQKKIVKLLIAYDNLIENNNRRIAILEEMAIRLYRNESMKSKSTCPLGDVIQFRRGRNITKATISEGNVPVVAGGIRPAYCHNKANTKAPVLTVSASGANAGYVNLYHVDIWASDCSLIDSNDTEYVAYFYVVMKNLQSQITFMQRGSAQPHVYPTDISKLEIPTLSQESIDELNKIFADVFNYIGNLKKKNEVLRKTRDHLLQRLISGDIDISKIEKY